MVSHYSPGWPQVFFFNIVCVFVHIDQKRSCGSSLLPLCSGDQVQFLRLGGKYSYLQSLLTSPEVSFLKEPFTWTSDCSLSFLLSLRSLLLYVVVSVLNPVLLLFLFWLHLVVVIIKWIQILLAPISLLNSLNYTRIYQILLPQFQSELICLPSTASKIYSFSGILSLRLSFQIRNLSPSLIPNPINHQRNWFCVLNLKAINFSFTLQPILFKTHKVSLSLNLVLPLSKAKIRTVKGKKII